jgi:hypothetical protein
MRLLPQMRPKTKLNQAQADGLVKVAMITQRNFELGAANR